MNYLEQLEKAIVYIEKNLGEDIKVEEIAGAVGYSYFHFHRIFEAVIGESVGNYLRTRRLARAANDLIYTDKRIIDIAMAYQFESQEAFNRAFKKVYEVTPGVFRKNRINVVLGDKKPLDGFKIRHLQEGLTIQPEIVEVGPVKIVGLRDTTTIKNNKIPAMWQKFNPRIDEIRQRTNNIRGYGICEVDPDFDMRLFNEDTEYKELVGVAVKDFTEIPPGMVAKTLQGGRYAVFTHNGKLVTLQLTYEYIWGTWVPGTKYEIDLRDDFEYYDEQFLGPEDENSRMFIYIPIK